MKRTSQTNRAAFKKVASIGYYSDKGKARPENEDHFYVPPETLDSEILRNKGYLCIVADGMGGHAKGEVASEIAVRRVAEEYYANANPDRSQALLDAIEVTNAEVYAAGQTPETFGMGTTLLAAVALRDHLIVANIGDSRAYLISGGNTKQITRDHSWVQDQIDEGLLTEEQGQQHPRKNILTRALGVNPQVHADLFFTSVRPEDALLLCSDGLWNLVRPAEMAVTVSHLPAEDGAKKLVALANERGGPDNITAIVIRFVKRPRQTLTLLKPLGTLAYPRYTVAVVLTLLLVVSVWLSIFLSQSSFILSIAPTATAFWMKSPTTTELLILPTSPTPSLTLALPGTTRPFARTPTLSATFTSTSTPQPTLTPTSTDTVIQTPTGTGLPTPTATGTLGPTLTNTVTRTPAGTSTLTPTGTSIHTLTKTSSLTPSTTRGPASSVTSTTDQTITFTDSATNTLPHSISGSH